MNDTTFNHLVEIYSKKTDNYNYTNFTLGYILKKVDNYFLIKTIDEYACLDSYSYILIDDISKVNNDSSYIRLFKWYVAYMSKNKNFDYLNLSNEIKDFETLEDMINYSLENNKIISLKNSKKDYVQTGKVISFTDNKLILDEIYYGKDFDIDIEINEEINLNDIVRIVFIDKEIFLYERYLDEKNKISEDEILNERN